MLRKSHVHPRRYAEPQLDLFEAYDVLEELREAGALDEPQEEDNE